MKLHLLGCSHHNAALSVRERLAFSPEATSDALGRLKMLYPGCEAVILSTCNRVEVYTACESPAEIPSHQQMAEFLSDFHGIDLFDFFDDLFERTGDDTVRHLFTVAASLDSMVVGEPQILAQVKQAYHLAQQCETVGPLIHAAFQAAIRVARRVSTETEVHQRRVSIPSVAVAEFASQIFQRLDDKHVLVIGAGEMGRDTLRYLCDAGARDIAVINRSAERAAAVAAEFDGRPVTWERLDDELAAADLIVSTTGATEPVIPLERYQAVEARRFQRPLFILDLAVPRDFDPAIGDCLGVYLYGIDDLQVACERNRRQRDRELPSALRIIEEETDRFMGDLYHRATGPMIRRLKENWHDIKEEELRRLFNKSPLLEDEMRDEIQRAFDRLVNKLLHPPLESLRDEAREGVPHPLLDAFKRLFQIKD